MSGLLCWSLCSCTVLLSSGVIFRNIFSVSKMSGRITSSQQCRWFGQSSRVVPSGKQRMRITRWDVPPPLIIKNIGWAGFDSGGQRANGGEKGMKVTKSKMCSGGSRMQVENDGQTAKKKVKLSPMCFLCWQVGHKSDACSAHSINAQSRMEVGKLMAQRRREEYIAEQNRGVQDAKDKEIETRIMEEQLDLAREIQEGLNPMGYYDKDGIQIKGYTKAAKGVGGDYFD